MRTHKVLSALAVIALILSLAPVASIGAAPLAAGAGTRQIPAGGTTSIRPVGEGADGLQQPELRPGAGEADGAGSINRPRPGFKNGKFPKQPLDAPTVPSSAVAGGSFVSSRMMGTAFEMKRMPAVTFRKSIAQSAQNWGVRIAREGG